MLMYLSIRYLHWDEETFWATTPKKFLALISAAMEVEKLVNGGGDEKGQKQQQPTKTVSRASGNYGSLDDLPGWD